MYPVLIVEDEPNIRGGLVRHSIWKELGVEKVLEADDGTSALDRLREEPRIRLVVTDIRMKKMSGLELIRELYEGMDYSGKVIVLSGYDDFEYAREAMKYGVADYLLKPVNMSELAGVAERAMALLEKESRQLASLRLLESAIPMLQEETLQRLVESAGSGRGYPRLREELRSYGLSWLLEHGRLDLMLLEADNLKVAGERNEAVDPDLVSFAVGNVTEHTLREFEKGRWPLVRFRSPKHNRWIVIFGETEESEETEKDAHIRFEHLETTLRARMQKYVKVGVSIAFVVGERGKSAGELYEEAEEKLIRIRLYGSAVGQEDENEESYRDVDLLSEAAALADLLKHGERRDVVAAAERFPQLVREWNLNGIKALHRRVFEWMLGIFEAARKSGWKQDHWRRDPLRLWEGIQAYDTMEALQSFVAEQLCQVNEALRETPHSQVLLTAERYILDHYASSLTVQTIADQAYVTPEWLSTLFRKHHGCTVLDYLTRTRLEKAKELLQDVRLKIYQISGMVGYRDTVYFSRLFRKHEGCTPKEYRNRIGIRADE